MKPFALLALLFAPACAVPRAGMPPITAPPQAAEIKDPNFELIAVESVPNAEDEGVSFTKVFIDGKETGKTPVGPRSQEKRLRLKLDPGNQPVRLEHWFLPPIGEWTRIPDPQQPRERFVRIEEKMLTRLTLRYAADGTPSLQVSREDAPSR